jgi:hypothetical protein
MQFYTSPQQAGSAAHESPAAASTAANPLHGHQHAACANGSILQGVEAPASQIQCVVLSS